MHLARTPSLSACSSKFYQLPPYPLITGAAVVLLGFAADLKLLPKVLELVQPCQL